MTSPAAFGIAVEMAFGYGPGDDPDAIPDGDWVDVTDQIEADQSSAVVTTMQGRTETGAGISPGDATIQLENLDGRFDPRNTAGPHFGDLTIGTPVRVRTGGGSESLYGTAVYGTDRYGAASTQTRWSGFVRSGFPQRFTDQVPGVEVEAHDLFGLAAQSDAPATAFDATVAELAVQPDHWWIPTATGWEDRVTGMAGRHTGGIVALDPAIDGADESWGMEDPDGWGTIEHAAARLDTTTESLLFAARFRFPTVADRLAATPSESTARITLISQAETTLSAAWFQVEVEQSNLFIEAITETERRSAEVGVDRSSLFDGRAHTIVVHVPAGSGDISLWVDGLPVDTTTDTVPTAVPLEFGPLYIGTAATTTGVAPYQGVIDPVIVWRDHPGTDELAADLHAAASLAWAGERLDQRLGRVADAVGLADHRGEFDVSGVVTLHGYRQGSPIELFQTVEETEQGRVWVDRHGRLRFASRGWAWTDPHSTDVQMVFTDDPDLLDDPDLDTIEIGAGTVLRDSELDLVNVAAVTSAFGREQTAENPTSIQRTGRRNPVRLSNLLHSSDRQSLAIAQWLIYSQSDTPLRIDRITFRVDDDPAVAGTFAQTVDLGSLVRLVKAAPVDCDGVPIGDPIDVSGHVIGIRNDFSFQGWTMSLWVDCTRANRSWFEIGVSELGGTDPLAF